VRRQLVVNADDLGLTTGVNDGIFDAHDHGVLTSASLFANAPATRDAIERLDARPSLGIGCHLALVDGRPALPPHRIPTLVERDGRFRRSWKPFIVACLQGHVSLYEVERELTAQVFRLTETGLRLTHLDTHKHVHAYPPIFDVVARVAVRFGIPVLRVPQERPWSLSGDGRDRRTVRTLWSQQCLNLATWPWCRRNYTIAARRGLRTPDFAGRVHTGFLNRGVIEQVLTRMRPGITELVVHPGFVDARLLQMNTRLLDSRRQEVDLLCDVRVRQLLIDEDIQLTRHDFTAGGERGANDVTRA
jgi:predicted glycoside hydrolase/deacetylase ChbG (UPF0249 family)